MKKYNSRDEKGITIIALIVTIIVLLILVTITISTITGNHAIINKSADAKNSTELKSEMELLRVAANTVRGKDRYGNLSFSLLKNELDYSAGENQTKVTEELDGNEKIGFKVKFLKSGRYYFLYNEDGEADIIFCGNEGIDNNKGILNANPRRKTVLINTTERVEGLLRTFSSIDKNNIKIYYGWSKSSIDEPDYTEIASNEIGGSGFDKRFLINYPNETGEYYLCLKATISEETTISKKFGEYKVIPEGVIPEYIVTFKKGKYVASIGEESIVTTGEVTLPSIIPNEQCEVLGWYNGDTLVGMPGKKINVSKSITLTAMARNTKAPTVVVAREDYNTFRWTATDVVPISGYQISKSSEMPSATGNGWTDGNINTGTYDISDEGTYYVYVKNEDGIVGQGMINAYTVSRNQGIGTTLTTKLESSSGDDFTETTKVLEGTTIYVVGSLSKGYQGLVLKKDNITILGGNQTIASNTNFSSTASPCIYKIVFDNNYPNNISDLSGSMAPIENIKYGESKTLTKNAFVVTQAGVPSKQLFEEWNTKADGSGISYEDGASVSNLTDEHNGVVTLYAQWTDANYEVNSPVKYTLTIEEAIETANVDSTIKVIQDTVTDESEAHITKNLTLDLNEATLALGNAIEVYNGSFTILGESDSKFNQDGVEEDKENSPDKERGVLVSSGKGIYNCGNISSIKIKNFAVLKSNDTTIEYSDESGYTGTLEIENAWIYSKGQYPAIDIGSASNIIIDNSWVYRPDKGYLIHVRKELPEMTIKGNSRVGTGNINNGIGYVMYFDQITSEETLNLNLEDNAIIIAGDYTYSDIYAGRKANIVVKDEAELYVNYYAPSSRCIDARIPGSHVTINTLGWIYCTSETAAIYTNDASDFTYIQGLFGVKKNTGSSKTYIDNHNTYQAFGEYENITQAITTGFWNFNSYDSYSLKNTSDMFRRGRRWAKEGRKRIYFDDSGLAQGSWTYIDQRWYYLWLDNNQPQLAADDTEHYVNGQMVTRWVKLSGQWFYLWEPTQNPTQAQGDTHIYEKGEMVIGWLGFGNTWYYFAPKDTYPGYVAGAMLCNGTYTINGTNYNFDANGVCTNP